MAKQIIKNAYLLLNNVNLSDHIESITLDWSVTDVQVTAMGDGGVQHLAGLQDNKLTLTFWQDHASASVGPTLDALLAAGTAVAFKVADSGSSFSATNPTYSGSAIAISYQPISGKVGDGQQSSVNLVCNGTITAGTS